MKLTSSSAFTRPTPVPKMPHGLVELMDGLARDVLMNNPTNVYEFCANHMEKLLEIKDGPSSKKPLTLDQKILQAQEKVRQRAKERQERFDKETKLLSKKYKQEPTRDNVDTPLIQEDSVVLNLKAPVYHVHDLEHSSEVEISHDPHADKTSLSEVTEASKNEEAQKITTNNLVEAENGNVETSLDKKPEDEPISGRVDTISDTNLEFEPILGKAETVSDKKPDNELISGKVETVTEKKSDNESISGTVATISYKKPDDKPISVNVETMSEKKPEDESIFGKIEIEEMHVEPLKESETIEIVSLENTSESQLQTITEVSDESSVSESTAILPKITIGDEHDEHELENKTEESVSELRLDLKNELTKQNLVEIPNQNKSKDPLRKSESNVVISKVAENESIPHINTISDQQNVVYDFNNDIKKDLSKNESSELITDHKEQQNDTETVEIFETASTPIPINTVQEDSHDGNVQLGKNINDKGMAHADGIRNNDSPKFLIPIIGSNVGELHDVDSSNGKTDNNNANEQQNIILGTIPNEKTTENEKETAETVSNANNERKTENECVNGSEIDKADSNIIISKLDTVKLETREVHQKLETNKGNFSDDYEQFHDNNTDANEDSISVIESDLSKTDEDSTQNNSNMDLETAAVTIQKVFRSFMFKSRNSTFEDTTNDENNSIDEDNDKKEEYYAAANLNIERRPLGLTRMDTVLQTVNEEKSLSLSTDDSSTLSSAATTIQAHVRGFLVRSRLNSSKTVSMNSLANSHEVLETEPEQQKNKTVLNIHIVPEEGNYLSRDESIITSMDLSLDGSPPSSVNLHPLSCDISERRKMLKREDAVQSVTPPSNNSGKLSEDSVKEVLIDENGAVERELTDDKTTEIEDHSKDVDNETSDIISTASTVTPTTIITISKSEDPIRSPREITEAALQRNGRSLTKTTSDESDVITPFVPSPHSSEVATELVHSGEFHDVVLPTKVSRNDTSVVREFKGVLVYFLFWNNS